MACWSFKTDTLLRSGLRASRCHKRQAVGVDGTVADPVFWDRCSLILMRMLRATTSIHCFQKPVVSQPCSVWQSLSQRHSDDSMQQQSKLQGHIFGQHILTERLRVRSSAGPTFWPECQMLPAVSLIKRPRPPESQLLRQARWNTESTR